MLEELSELNPLSIVVTIIAYGFCMIVLWKGVTGWDIKHQIIITIVALPIIYLAVNYQLNKG